MQAMFGAGCFWGVEDSFRKLGLTNVTVGYSGGHKDEPTYEQVCKTDTGHVEVVLVEYDSQKISYQTLLENFFACHNPTHVNRQGPDFGTQYRSVIFTYDDEQQMAANHLITKLNNEGKFAQPIATKVEKATKFWPAEAYHQQYFAKNDLKFCPSS